MRLGIVGRRQAGKSTLALSLVDDGWTRMALADPLKDACVEMLNAFVQTMPEVGGPIPAFSRERLDRDKERLRPLLQWVGTELAKEYFDCPDIWNNRLLQRLNALEPDVPVVVDDVRFPEEIEALRGAGFYFIKIVRPQEAELEETDTHRSETLVDHLYADAVVHNTGTVQSLLGLAYAAIASWSGWIPERYRRDGWEPSLGRPFPVSNGVVVNGKLIVSPKAIWRSRWLTDEVEVL